MSIEESKASLRALVGVIVLVTAFSGLAVLGVSLFLEMAYEPPPLHTAAEFKGPLLEVAEGEVLRDVRAAEDRLLHNYGWSDRTLETARIPIEEAMKIVAARTSTRGDR